MKPLLAKRRVGLGEVGSGQGCRDNVMLGQMQSLQGRCGVGGEAGEGGGRKGLG